MIEYFRNNRDKLLHVVIGTMFFLITLFIFDAKTAMILTFVLGFLKEVNDRGRWLKWALTSNNKKGIFDMWDLVATCIIPLIISAIISA